MRARLVDRLDQLVDDVPRRRHIGVAHAEIDDIGTPSARSSLQAVHFREYIGRQALDAVKVFAQNFTPRRRDGDGAIMAPSARGPWQFVGIGHQYLLSLPPTAALFTPAWRVPSSAAGQYIRKRR